MTDVSMRWVGTDATGAAAASVKKNLDSVGKAAGGASGAMEKMAPASKQASGALSSLDHAAGGALKGLTGVSAALGVGALVALTGKTIDAVAEMARLSEASGRLETSFDAMAASAGTSGDRLLSSLKKSSGGAISEYDLMLAGNKAMMLGVADTSDEMSKLMQVAAERGRAMGLSMTQAFGDLVTGLGRMSPMILDNLGITINAEATYAAYAETLGKTADSLTDAEKKQALVNKVMAEATGSTETVASSTERLSAAWADMKVSLGDMFAPALAAGLEALAAGARGLVEVKDTIAASMDTSESAMAATLRTRIADAQRVFNDGQLSMRYAQEMINNLKVATAQAEELGRMAPTFADFGLYPEEVAAIQALKDMQDAQRALNSMASAEVDIRREITSEMRAGSSALAANAEDARRKASADALKEQYAGVAAIQENYRNFVQMQEEVAASAQDAGLSIAQTDAIVAQAAAQYGILTENGYTSAQALDMVTNAMDAQIGTLPALGAMLIDLGDTLATVIPAAAAIASASVANLFANVMADVATMGRAVMNIGMMNPGPDAKARQNAPAPVVKYPSYGAGTTNQFDGMTLMRTKAADAASAAAEKLANKAGSAASKLGDVAEKAGDLSGKLQGLLDKVPGLKGTSPVTEQQMSDAKLGIPQNFADDYLRRLTDEVMNGVDWAGVDMADAAKRAGIDPSLPVEAQLKLFSQAWQDSSLFSDPKNLELINMDAVKAAMAQQQAANTGAANINALFGIGDDATVQAVASLGLSVQSGLSEWLTTNGFADAGSKLAAAIGDGVAASGDTIGNGIGSSVTSWVSGTGVGVAEAGGKALAAAMSAAFVVTPTINLPGAATPPGAPGSTPTAPGKGATPVPTPSKFNGFAAQAYAAGMINASRNNNGAQVVNVSTVINERMDEAKFARMLRDALRKGTMKT